MCRGRFCAHLQSVREVASVAIMTARGNKSPARLLRDETTSGEIVAWMHHLAHRMHLATISFKPFPSVPELAFLSSLPCIWLQATGRYDTGMSARLGTHLLRCFLFKQEYCSTRSMSSPWSDLVHLQASDSIPCASSASSSTRR